MLEGILEVFVWYSGFAVFIASACEHQRALEDIKDYACLIGQKISKNTHV